MADPDRILLLEELFCEALERSQADRAGYLEEACGDDAELRQELEALLRAHALADVTVDQLGGSSESGAAVELDEERGAAIGPYRLLKKLGEGECSLVFLAVRADASYHKLAAVKLIKRGMDSERILRRFHQERQILAALSHPNIAHLLDGGSTAGGRPYFVMEYIDGERIDVYCENRELSVGQRLDLFRTVCSAVHFAHQNLIVHRDLKPGNIMVTARGDVKLLDFGIAKLLDPELAAEQTATVGRLMTPRYASPEQVLGQQVTTASDVYSLGVLLYELLTGRTPYLIEGQTLAELEREICDSRPEPPSTAVRRDAVPEVPDRSASLIRETGSRERLARRLRGDLDTIVMTALRKEPGRRYSSVRDLEEDLQRHQDNMPVRARPDTAAYRAGKFIKRHALGVAAAVVVLASLIAGVVVSTWQATVARAAQARAEEAQRESERQRLLSEQVSGFLVEIFQVSDPGEARGNTITAREILDRGAERIRGELDEQPETQAGLMDVMASVYQGLGLYDAAEPLYSDSLEIRRRVLGDDHKKVGESINNLAAHAAMAGHADEAEKLYREALEILKAAAADEPAMVGTVMSNLGSVLREQGRYAESERLHREAVEVFAPVDPTDRMVVTNLNNLATVLTHVDKREEAVELYDEVLELTRQAFGDEHPNVAVCLSNTAGVLIDMGRNEQAEQYYRESLRIMRKVLGDEHPFVGLVLNNLASLLRDDGDQDAAEKMYRESIAISRRTLGDTHPNLALALHNLAYLLMIKDELDEAERLAAESTEMWRELYGDQHPNLAKTLVVQGHILAEQDRWDEAEHRYRSAVDIYRTALPQGHPDAASGLLGLGRALNHRGESATAEPLLREAVEQYRSQSPNGGWQVALAEGELGKSLTKLGRYPEAERLLLSSHAALAADPAQQESAHQAALLLMELYEAWGRPELAARYR